MVPWDGHVSGFICWDGRTAVGGSGVPAAVCVDLWCRASAGHLCQCMQSEASAEGRGDGKGDQEVKESEEEQDNYGSRMSHIRQLTKARQESNKGAELLRKVYFW